MDLDARGIDEEAEDPPVKWVALAVAGLLLASLGIVTIGLGLVGLRGDVVGAVPAFAVVFDLNIPILIVGVGLFVLSMTEWNPDLET